MAEREMLVRSVGEPVSPHVPSAAAPERGLHPPRERFLLEQSGEEMRYLPQSEHLKGDLCVAPGVPGRS